MSSWSSSRIVRSVCDMFRVSSRSLSTLRRATGSRMVSAESTTVLRVEGLEQRRMLSSVPWILSTGDLTQDWTDVSQITTNDDWSGVDSIQGFRGDGLTSGTDTDPQTLTADDLTPVLDVIANQTNPNTLNTGGVAEFEITNATVALQGSGTADAPYLSVYLDTTDVKDVTIDFNVRDIDGSLDDSVQQVALQYRVGNSGSWANVSIGSNTYIADATSGPNLDTQVAAVHGELPSAADNQSEVQIRVITTNASGSDEWVGIDDIVATGTLTKSYVDDDWSAFSIGQAIADADPIAPGNQAATFGTNAFATVQGGVDAVAADGTVSVGDGTYVENVLIDKNVELVSQNGRASTTIEGISDGALGTILVTSNTTGVKLGGLGQGFTIIGIDNGNPAVENAAIYFQGGHSDAQIIDNEVVANGDGGLTTEFGATISGFVIDSNEFSGQTFVGSQPDGDGFSAQFSLANVPRQLVVIGGGTGGGNTSNITFTNNDITGTAGGISETDNSGAPVAAHEQGNTLVTIDSAGAVITGNTFGGTTTRFGSALRARGSSVDISSNSFLGAGMGLQTSYLFIANPGTPNGLSTDPDDIGDVLGANSFDPGALVLPFLQGNSTVFPAASIQATIDALGAGNDLRFSGDYSENVDLNVASTLGGDFALDGTLTVSAAGAVLDAGFSPGIMASGSLTLTAGSTLTAEVNGVTPGTGHDQYVVTGTVDLGGATLDAFGTIVSTPGDSIVLVDNDAADAVVGTFAGIANGDVTSISGQDFVVFYDGGTGNDVVLVAAPSTATIYVDDDWAGSTNGSDPDGGGPAIAFGVDAFATIQDAIDAVDPSGTVVIYTHAGSGYNEALAIGSKSLTLEAALANTPVVDGTALFSTGLDISGAGSVVIVDGLTFENHSSDGINSEGVLTLVDSTIVGGFNGVVLDGGSADIDSSVVQGATIFGVQVSNGGTADIDFSEITGNVTAGVIVSDGSATIDNSILSSNATGLLVTGSGVGEVHGSNLDGNLSKAVQNATATVVDASGNWWGSNSEAAVASATDGPVDFTPFLDVLTDNNGGDVGFVGDNSLLNVTTLGEQTGLAGRIQEGVDSVDVGGTVLLLDGQYNESGTLISQSVTLTGQSEAGVVIAPAGEDDNINSTTGGIAQQGIIVDASDVTISNLTIDGQANTALTPGKNNFRMGIYTDFDSGLVHDNVTIQDTTIQNIYRRGIQLLSDFGGLNKGTGHVVDSNTIDNVELSFGIIVFESDVLISNNTISNVSGAIASNYISAASLAPLLTVQGNVISDTATGMNLSGLADGSLIGGPSVSDANDIDLTQAGGGSDDIGIVVQYAEGVVTVQGNTITTSEGDSGLWLYHNEAETERVDVIDNVLTSSSTDGTNRGEGTGVFITDDGDFFGDEDGWGYANLTGNTITDFARGVDVHGAGDSGTGVRALVVSISDNDITGSDIGVRVFEADAAADNGGDLELPIPDGYAVEVTIDSNAASIHGNVIGIDVDGGSATITSNSIYDNTTGIRFSNSGIGSVSDNDFNNTNDNTTDILVETTSGTVTIGDGNQYAGDSYFIDNQSTQDLDLTSHTLADYEGLIDDFRIEDQMFHGPDNGTSGIIRLVASTLFVSTPGTGINDETIQNAIDAADVGESVVVEAGTYSETVDVNKKITLDGAGSGSVPATDTIIDGRLIVSGSGASTVDRTTVQELRIDGSTNHGVTASGVSFLEFNDVASVNHDLDGFHVSNVDDILMTDIIASDNGASSPATVGKGIDLNGVRTALLTNITANNNYSGGVGITARAATTGNSSDIVIDGGTFNNPDSGRPDGTNGINLFVDDTEAGSSITNVEIKGTIVSEDHALGGITLFNSGLTSTISGVQIGQNGGDSVSLSNNAVDLVIFGNVDDVELTADLTAGANTSIGVSILGLSDTGLNSPTNISVAGSTFSGYALATPAILLASPDAATPAPFGDLISINDVDASNTVFDGVDVNSATTSQLFTIEDLVVHSVDVSGTGTVNFDPASNIHLTTSSFVSGFDTAARVQRAVDAADANDTIFIQDGVYTDSAQVFIDKDLTIIGEGKTTTTLTKDFDTSSSGDARGWWLIDTGVTLDLSHVGFDGSGFLTWQALRHKGSGTIDNVQFDTIQFNAFGPLSPNFTGSSSYAGTALVAFGGAGANVDVTNSMFADIGRQGVFYFGAGTTGIYQDNMYAGKGAGDHLDYAVEVGGGAVASIIDSTISGNLGEASTDGSTSAGVLATTYFGGGTEANLSGNTISGNTTGVSIGFDSTDTSVVTIDGDQITGNTGDGVSIVGDGATLSVVGATITDNGATGVDVNGSTALIEGTDLRNNLVGIQVSGDAVVDAGDSSDSGTTGLSTGSGVTNSSSIGGNTLTGYSGAGGNYAIENLNEVAVGNLDVFAEDNDYGSSITAVIESVIFDDTDDPTRTVVIFSQSPAVPAASPVYVNDDWVGTGLGTDADGAGTNGAAFGTDQFANFTDAVAAVLAGGQIIVLNGSYDESFVIDKAVSISTDVDPDNLPQLEVELTVTSGSNDKVIIEVAADNVSIDGLNILVDRDHASGGIAASNVAQPDVNLSGGSFDSLSLSNNVIESIGENIGSFDLVGGLSASAMGIALIGQGGPIHSVTVTDNQVLGTFTATPVPISNPLGFSGFTRGLYLGQVQADASGNTLQGFAQDLHNQFASGGTTSITGNTFNLAGVDISSPNANSPIDLSSNQFAVGSELFPQSLLIRSHHDATSTVTVFDNTFTGHTTGIVVDDSSAVVIDDNDFTAAVAAVDAENIVLDTDKFGSLGNTTPVGATITNNEFFGTGTALVLRDSNPGPGVASPTFDNVIVGTDGNENTFNSTLDAFIVLDPDGPGGPVDVDLDATENVFGVTGGDQEPAVMSLDDLFELEDKILHTIDVGSLGLVTVVPGELFVTTSSFDGVNTLTPSIQRAIDAASSGDTIFIEDGSYSETVVIDKAITLDGETAGSVIIAADSASPIVDVAGTSGSDDITLLDLVLDGDDGVSTSTGIKIQSSDSLGTLRVENSEIRDFSSFGIDVTGNSVTGISVQNVEVVGSTFADNGATSSGGHGHISLFTYNGDALLQDLVMTSTVSGHSAIQLRGVGAGDGVSEASMGNVTVDNVDISGLYRIQMIGIQRYSDVDNLSFNDVKLGGAGSEITGSFGGSLRFDGVGSGTVSTPATFDLGNTELRGLDGSSAQPHEIEFAPDNSFAFLRVDGTNTVWSGTAASSLTLSQAFDVEDRILHFVDKLHPTHGGPFGPYKGFVDIQTNQAFITDQADSGVLGDGSIQRGIDIVAGGGTVNVADGFFVEDLVIDKADLELVGQGAGVTTIQGIATNPQGSFPLATPNINVLASGVQIHDFTIASPVVPAGEYSSGIVIDSPDVEIFDNEFISSQGDTPPLGANDSLTNVMIQTWSGSNSGKSSDVDGLSIHDNTFDGDGKGYYGIFVNPQGEPVGVAPADTVRIEDNSFTGNIWRAVEVERSNALIDQNNIAPGPDTLQVWGGSGISIRNFTGDPISDVTVSNNTIIGTDGDLGQGFANGILLGFGAQSLEVAVSGITTISDNETGIRVNTGTIDIDGVAISNSTVGVLLSAGVTTITGSDLTDNDTGVLVESGAAAAIVDNPATITGGTIGIDVDGGTALVENTDLNGNTIGVLIQNSGVADLGDPTDSDITGLGAGSATNGSSAGLNDFSGFTATASTTNGAIVVLNNDGGLVGPQGIGSGDIPAFFNVWNDPSAAGIENVIWHDADDNNVAFVDYTGLANLSLSLDQDPVDEGETIDPLTLDGSFTNEAQAHTVTIDWGDGTADTVLNLSAGTFDFTADHTYADNDAYIITTTVKEDATTVEVMDTITANVANVNPTLTVTGNQSVDEGSLLSLIDVGMITDPGFDTETFTFFIDWGDLTSADTGPATVDLNGSVGVDTEASFDGSHTFADDGIYVVTVRVADDDMTADFVTGTDGVDFVEDTFQVTVENVVPDLTVIGNQTVDEGSLLSIIDLGMITDPGFDTETFEYYIDWGDLTLADTGPATIDLNGSVGVDTEASFDGSHTYADDGLYNVTVRVADDDMTADFTFGTDGIDFVEQTFQVTVDDVSPTIAVSAVSSNTDEGSVFTLDLGLVTEPGDDTITQFIIEWGDGDSDNLFGDPENTSHNHTYDDGIQIEDVRITLIDENGAHTQAGVPNPFPVTVDNVDPTATFFNTGAVDEGTGGTVGFTGQADVSTADTLAGFHYAFDFDNDGTFESGDGTYAGSAAVSTSSVPASFLADGEPGAFRTVRGRIIDKDGGFTDYTTDITIDNVVPVFDAGADTSAAVNTLFTRTLMFTDPGSETLPPPGWIITVNYGDGSGDQAPASFNPLTKTFDLEHTYTSIGNFTVMVEIDDQDGVVASDSFMINVFTPTFQVANFTEFSSGFDVQFNRAADLLPINLYDGNDVAIDLPDVIVSVGGNDIDGSIAWDAATNTLTFVQTGGVLADGTYDVTLRSGSDAFQDTFSNALDGDANGTPGDDFETSFVVSSSGERVVSLPDFARGAGQDVSVPALAVGGIDLPISIDDASSVTAVDVDVVYDPALLNISGASLGDGPIAAGGWNITTNPVSPGLLKITISGTTALTGLDVELIRLDADIPNSAPYADNQVIRLENLEVNESAIAAGADFAVHKAAYLGDSDGDGQYLGNDAALISRVVVDLDTGFDAHDWTDPVIVADSTGNGALSGQDASNVAQEAALIDVPEIPLIPGIGPLVANTPGIDPELSLSDKFGAPGDTITMPVTIEILPAEAADPTVLSATFDVFFDDGMVALTPADIDQGSFWDSGDGWSLTKNVLGGQARLVFFNSAPSEMGTGDIALLSFTLDSGLMPGDVVNLDIEPVDPNEGNLTWTNSDGSIAVTFTADFEPDGDVDNDDLTLWEAGYGISSGAVVQDGDANRDGAVSGLDFLAWQSQFGSSLSPLAAAKAAEETASTESANASTSNVAESDSSWINSLTLPPALGGQESDASEDILDEALLEYLPTDSNQDPSTASSGRRQIFHTVLDQASVENEQPESEEDELELVRATDEAFAIM